MNNFFQTARVTNTYRADNPRAAKLTRIHPGLVKVRRYQDDSGAVRKTIEIEMEAPMKEEVVILEKKVKRQSVASTVRPFVSEPAVKSIKQDLKDDDWYAVGDGRHTVSSGFQQVEIIQDDSNHDLFRVTVTRS